MEKARAACLACNHTEPAGHGGRVSYDAAGENNVRKSAVYIDRSPRGQVTALPADVEEKTAELYRRWCGLDTIDALLMLHVSNGGTCATFGAYLNRVQETIGKLDCKRESYRATAWAKFQALIKRFKPFLKSKLHSWNDGHGGAIRKERVRSEGELAQGDLFNDR